MTGCQPVEIVELTAADLGLMDALLDVFGDAFEEREIYGAARPTAEYMRQLLARDHFIALVARGAGGSVVGGLAAYQLEKFERARSEIYIYDLAVTEGYRRRGVATALIQALRRIAWQRGAYVIFVQADHGDDPAIALYDRLGVRENVLHFDIEPAPAPDS